MVVLNMADHNQISGDDLKNNAILTETEADMKANKNETLNEAKAATDKEHKMTLRQGLKLYPKAVAWSLLISTCIAMEGFDLALVNGLYGFAPWRQKYGELQPDGSYELSAAWQAGLSNGANVGSIIGLFINGWVSERFGYRYTIITCLTLLMGFTAIFFTAQKVEHLLIAEILCGIPVRSYLTSAITLKNSAFTFVLTFNTVGRLPNPDHYVCFRGLPCSPQRLPYHLRQLLLGSRTADRRRCHQVAGSQRG